MGEDFPLDPNHVEPPQEGQPEQQPSEGETTQIEVTSNEGSAGWNSEHGGEDGSVSDEHARDDTTDPNREPSQLTPLEERRNPDRIRNKAKAEAMAHVENRYGHYGYKPDGGAWHRRVNGAGIERNVQGAGDDYEINALAERDGKTPEQVRKLLKSNRTALVEYGHAIAENQREYGQPLSPNLEVFEVVKELAGRYPDLIKDGKLSNDQMEVTISSTSIAGGALEVKTRYFGDADVDAAVRDEEWLATALNRPGDSWNRYAVRTVHGKDDANVDTEGYDSVETTKRRALKADDVERLKQMLSSANFDPQPEDDDEDDQYVDEGNASDSFYAQTAGNGDDEHGPSYSQHLEDIGATHNGRTV